MRLLYCLEEEMRLLRVGALQSQVISPSLASLLCLPFWSTGGNHEILNPLETIQAG